MILASLPSSRVPITQVTPNVCVCTFSLCSLEPTVSRFHTLSYHRHHRLDLDSTTKYHTHAHVTPLGRTTYSYSMKILKGIT